MIVRQSAFKLKNLEHQRVFSMLVRESLDGERCGIRVGILACKVLELARGWLVTDLGWKVLFPFSRILVLVLVPRVLHSYVEEPVLGRGQAEDSVGNIIGDHWDE